MQERMCKAQINTSEVVNIFLYNDCGTFSLRSLRFQSLDRCRVLYHIYFSININCVCLIILDIKYILLAHLVSKIKCCDLTTTKWYQARLRIEYQFLLYYMPYFEYKIDEIFHIYHSNDSSILPLAIIYLYWSSKAFSLIVKTRHDINHIGTKHLCRRGDKNMIKDRNVTR